MLPFELSRKDTNTNTRMSECLKQIVESLLCRVGQRVLLWSSPVLRLYSDRSRESYVFVSTNLYPNPSMHGKLMRAGMWSSLEGNSAHLWQFYRITTIIVYKAVSHTERLTICSLKRKMFVFVCCHSIYCGRQTNICRRTSRRHTAIQEFFLFFCGEGGCLP